jgi:hypothetical protein
MVGRNLNEIDPTTVEKHRFGRLHRVCFIVVNTYEVPRYRLGPGPLNDSLTVAQHLVELGHRVCFLHNTTPAHFKKWLEFFLQNVTESLFIFYTGHGASIPDRDGDEEDGKDEVMVFDKGYVKDDDLAICLRNFKKVDRLVLLSDCCHSGTIWDLDRRPTDAPFPPNILSISAAEDSQTAKQTKVEKMDQGIFTYFFWDQYDEDPMITPLEMKELINEDMKKFKQKLMATTTSEEMLTQPILPPFERKHGEGHGAHPA